MCSAAALLLLCCRFAARQVARVCEALLVKAPSVLPAATVCGAGYLNVCTDATSAICRKCLAEAVDLQNRLRWGAFGLQPAACIVTQLWGSMHQRSHMDCLRYACLPAAICSRARRSLSNYQCRRPQYYMPLQSQECTTVINGWLSAVQACTPVLAPGMYDRFRSVQANTSMQSNYFYWDGTSQTAYTSFCNAFAGGVVLAPPVRWLEHARPHWLAPAG